MQSCVLDCWMMKNVVLAWVFVLDAFYHQMSSHIYLLLQLHPQQQAYVNK
jgi:hypothetical protein